LVYRTFYFNGFYFLSTYRDLRTQRCKQQLISKDSTASTSVAASSDGSKTLNFLTGLGHLLNELERLAIGTAGGTVALYSNWCVCPICSSSTFLLR